MSEHLKGETFSAYIDGELPPERSRELRDHLESCTACTRELEQYQEVKIRYSRLPARSAPPQLLRRLRETVQPAPFIPRRLSQWFSPSTLWRPLAALSAAAVVSIAVFLKMPSRDQEFVDLDSLLVAHCKYQGEVMVPHPDMSQSTYSARLAAFFRDDN